jgi:hypothetical protein
MIKNLHKILDRVELDRPFLFKDKIQTVASHYPRQGGGNKSVSPKRGIKKAEFTIERDSSAS